MSSPNVITPNVVPHEGDVAFAVSVATLYDLTIGRVGWPVSLTRHRSETVPTLTLANRFPGGPVLNILPWDWDINPSAPPIFAIGNDGISSMQIGGHIDFVDQEGVLPDVPDTIAGSNVLRMYFRGTQLFFQLSHFPGEEYQIPIGQPPGPSVRYSFWMGGG